MNPNSALAHASLGGHLCQDGKFNESIIELRKALELTSLSPGYNVWIGAWYYLNHDFLKALDIFDKFLEIHGETTAEMGYLWKSRACIQLAKFDEALYYTDCGMKIAETNVAPFFRANLALIFAKQGRKVEARKVIEELEAIPMEKVLQSAVNSMNFASVWVALKENDEALRWLDICFNRRDASLSSVKVDCSFGRN